MAVLLLLPIINNGIISKALEGSVQNNAISLQKNILTSEHEQNKKKKNVTVPHAVQGC